MSMCRHEHTNRGLDRRMRVGAIGSLMLAAVSASAQITYPPHPNAGEVNFSGATLFRPFFVSPATTNDAIDVDGDGFFGYDPNTWPYVDQLAATYGGGPGLSTFWAVSYRSVGSINGLGEFVDYQLCGRFSGTVPPEDGLLNRFLWASQGVKLNGPGADCLDDEGYPNPDGTSDNDDGSPFCRSSVDGAAIDVPSAWAVRGPGGLTDARWDRKPTQPGYGRNPITSWNTGWVSQLESFFRDCSPVPLNANVTNPDEYTVYDTGVAWGPIAYIANRGVARPDLNGDGQEGDIRLSDLRHLFLTGRLRHGENLAASTRSAGSGTRNGVMNTSGVDPAWGRGDNLDDEWAITTDAYLGENRRVTNAQGSSGVETVVRVSRLAIGYTGLAGAGRAADDAKNGHYEVLNVMFDDRGGTDYVRPTVEKVVYNANPSTGWQLGGPVTFVTRGDPFEDDPNAPQYMESRSTAWYLRNIILSSQAFGGAPGTPEQYNMPGEYLANVFFLAPGIQALPDFSNPSQFLPNSGFNPVLAQYIRTHNDLGSGVGLLPYGSVNPAGQVPFRKVRPQGYADGQTQAYAYKDTAGVLRTIAGGQRLAARNRVQGDFNRDGRRDINDIDQMLTAYQDPLNFEQGMPTWPPGGSPGDQVANVVITHVIGDFDGNGDFDAADVRYFCDGLALDPANPALDPSDPFAAHYGPWLNRRTAFTRVDTRWQQLTGNNNFFGTFIANPLKSYQPGDSAGDVAGSAAGPAPGADPRGADGIVNAADIDHVYRAFRNQFLGFDNPQVDWSVLSQAVFSDLSADMTGPEIVNGRRTILINQEDVDYLVRVILGTDYGDANLDGVVNAVDVAIVQAHLGQPGGWAEGNFDGDEFVDEDDLLTAQGCWQQRRGDANCDGQVNAFDIDAFVLGLTNLPAWISQYGTNCTWQCALDCSADGSLDAFDIDPFVELLTGN
jgi:hypothetical protein